VLAEDLRDLINRDPSRVVRFIAKKIGVSEA
jgi:hypothetical protein